MTIAEQPRYQVRPNRALKCVELVDTHHDAVLAFADYDQPQALAGQRLTCDRLNAEWQAQVELLDAGLVPTATESAADAQQVALLEQETEALEREAAAVAVVARMKDMPVPPKGTPAYEALVAETMVIAEWLADMDDLALSLGMPLETLLAQIAGRRAQTHPTARDYAVQARKGQVIDYTPDTRTRPSLN